MYQLWRRFCLVFGFLVDGLQGCFTWFRKGRSSKWKLTSSLTSLIIESWEGTSQFFSDRWKEFEWDSLYPRSSRWQDEWRIRDQTSRELDVVNGGTRRNGLAVVCQRWKNSWLDKQKISIPVSDDRRWSSVPIGAIPKKIDKGTTVQRGHHWRSNWFQ